MTEQEFNRVIEKIESDVKRLEETVKPPPKHPLFVAVGRVIMLGQYCVGRMKSNTYAIRTANALNQYKPDKRGR